MLNKKPVLDGVRPKSKTERKKEVARQDSKPQKEDFSFKKCQRRYFKFLEAIFIGVAVLLFLAAGSLLAYEKIYQNKIFEGVSVLGLDVGGKNTKELEQSLQEIVDRFRISIENNDQKYEVSLNDLGIAYDTKAMVRESYAYGRNGSVFKKSLERTRGFLSNYKFDLGFINFDFEKKKVAPRYAASQQRLEVFLNDLEKKINVTAKDSEIKVAEGKVEIIPAVFGKKLKTELLEQDLIQAATSFSPQAIRVETDEVAPAIFDENTKALAERTAVIAAKNVTLEYNENLFSPSKETLTDWISFIKTDNGGWQLTIDSWKIKSYLTVIGSSINIWPQDRIVRVENGVKETVAQEGIDGLLIDDSLLISQLTDKLLTADLPAIRLAIPMKTAPFATKKEEVTIADWDKYIDINLSTQTLVAYEKGGAEKGRWLVATGKPGYETPVGTWLVIGKSSWIRMTGGWGTSEYYNLYPVKWVTWFKGGGYAIHDAYWRSSFGYTGSHGCINMPDDGAIFIYNWADIGTPVIVHY